MFNIPPPLEFIPSLSGGGFFVPARERERGEAERAPRESKRRPSDAQDDSDDNAPTAAAGQTVRRHVARAARGTPRPFVGGPPGTGHDLATRRVTTHIGAQDHNGLPDAVWMLVAAYCERHLPSVLEVLGQLLEAEGQAPALLKATLETPRTINLLIQASPTLITGLDRKDRTPDGVFRAVAHWSVEFGSPDDDPASTWRALVSINGLALRHAPASVLDPALCEAAVRQNPCAVAFVPHELRTAEMWQSPHLPVGELIELVPPEARTPAQWRKVMARDHGQMLHLKPGMQDVDQLLMEASVGHAGCRPVADGSQRWAR